MWRGCWRRPRRRESCACTPSRRPSRRSCSRSATASRCACSASRGGTSRRRCARGSSALGRCSPIDAHIIGEMPIYEYRRPDGTKFEIRQSFSDEPLKVDPETGVPVVRVLHAPAVHFKGKGFYNTDYGTRKRQRETAAASSSQDGSAKQDSSSDDASKTSDGKATAEKSSSESAKPRDAKPKDAKP